MAVIACAMHWPYWASSCVEGLGVHHVSHTCKQHASFPQTYDRTASFVTILRGISFNS